MRQSLPSDPVERLRYGTDRAISRGQHQVSVNPWAVRRLLREHEEMRVELERKRASEEVEHDHIWRDSGDVYRHAHTRGDVPHGHHGSRYLKERPVVEI